MAYERVKNYNPLKFSSRNVDGISLRLVPAHSKVLELGSSGGYLGKIMRQDLRCKVVGVEIDKDAGKTAKKYLDHVIIGSIENQKTIYQIIKNGPYDIIFASAILEHLVNPDLTIRKLSQCLTKNGNFIITLPNIAHYTARLSLLRGNFKYTDGGIFDKTHLHFYTLQTARGLLEKNNLIILQENFEFFGPKLLSFLFQYFPNVFAYQFVFKATPKFRKNIL